MGRIKTRRQAERLRPKAEHRIQAKKRTTEAIQNLSRSIADGDLQLFLANYKYTYNNGLDDLVHKAYLCGYESGSRAEARYHG